MKTMTETMSEKADLDRVQAALYLQDAYWYAKRACGEDDGTFSEVLRSTAMRLSARKAKLAGLAVTVPKKLADARVLLLAIESFAAAHRIDASLGEPLPEETDAAPSPRKAWLLDGVITWPHRLVADNPPGTFTPGEVLSWRKMEPGDEVYLGGGGAQGSFLLSCVEARYDEDDVVPGPRTPVRFVNGSGEERVRCGEHMGAMLAARSFGGIRQIESVSEPCPVCAACTCIEFRGESREAPGFKHELSCSHRRVS